MKTWFYLDSDQQPQEAPEGHLAGLLLCGTITRATLVWAEGESEWQPAEQVMPEQFDGGSSSMPWFTNQRADFRDLCVERVSKAA
jgi:hypothetical protein